MDLRKLLGLFGKKTSTGRLTPRQPSEPEQTFVAEQPLQPATYLTNGTNEAAEPEINEAGPSQTPGLGNVAPTVEQSIDSSMALIATQSAQSIYPISQSMWPNKRVWQYMTLPYTITSAFQNNENTIQSFRSNSPCKLAKYFEAKWEVDQALQNCKPGPDITPVPPREDILYSREICPYVNKSRSKGKSKFPKRLAGPKKKSANTSRMICPSGVVDVPKEQTVSCAEAQSATQAAIFKQNALKMIFKKASVKTNYAIEEATTSNNAMVLYKPPGEPPRQEIATICRPWEQNPLRRICKGSAEDAKLFKVPKPVKAARPPKGTSPHTTPRAGWPLHTFTPPQLYGNPKVVTSAMQINGEIPDEPMNLKVGHREETEPSNGHVSENVSKQDTCTKRKAKPSAGQVAKILKLSTEAQLSEEVLQAAQKRPTKIRVAKEKTTSKQDVWTMRNNAHHAEKINNAQECDETKHHCYPKILIAKEKTANNQEVWTIREKEDAAEDSVEPKASTDIQPKAPTDVQKSVKVQIDLSKIFGASKMFIAKEKLAVNKKIRTIDDLAVCVEPAASDDALDIQDVSEGVTEPNTDYWIKKEAIETAAPMAEAGSPKMTDQEIWTVQSDDEQAPENTECYTGESIEPAGLNDNAAASGEAEFSNQCSVIKVVPRPESDAEVEITEMSSITEAELLQTPPLEDTAGSAAPSTSTPKEDLSNFWLFEITSQAPAMLVENTASGPVGNAANASGVTHVPCAHQEKLLRSLSTNRIRRLMKLHETLINHLGGVEAMPERRNELDAFSRELILELVRRQYKVKDDALPHLRLAIIRCLRTDPMEKDDDIIKKLLQRKKKQDK